ncbi:ATP-binding protein, partial [Candidatus Albibeggiatoa sp. nov. BB20]
MQSYISSLHVENIGLFNKLDIEFNPRMNILIGANGSGKTSILRLLTYAS